MHTEEIIHFVLVLVYYFKLISSGPVPYTSCRSTDACILLRDCESYMVFINALDKPLKPPVVKFLNEKQCGFHDGQPKVCCSDSLKGNSATTVTGSNGKTCNVENECIPLKTCKPYMDIVNAMRKPLKPAFVSFLRAQQCGFQDGYPTVCCTDPPEAFKVQQKDKQNSKTKNKPSSADVSFDDDYDEVEVSTKSATTKRKTKKRVKVLSDIDLAEFYEWATAYDFLRR